MKLVANLKGKYMEMNESQPLINTLHSPRSARNEAAIELNPEGESVMGFQWNCNKKVDKKISH